MLEQTHPYNEGVVIGRPPSKEAPLFGQRLAAVRRSQGLTQKELAERLGVTREMIDYYERRAPNPALDFIERAAKAMDVSVAQLLGSQPHTMRAKPGPVSQLERRIEQVKLLPHKKQQLIVEFLDAIISTEKA